MIRLSVNVNKVATLRNSRGGRVPSVLEAVDVCLAAGAPGITVHPRADRRHITPEDVREVSGALSGRDPRVEFNIEGDPRSDLRLPGVVAGLQTHGIRVSVFVDALPESIRWAASIGADRVELYTEPYARAFEAGPDQARRSFERFADVARLAHSLGLGVNAGHDLDLENLVYFRELPHLDEVSIGHAIVSRALLAGLSTVVREYLDTLAAVDGVQRPLL
jgi:pyridoxine 5-phosphate synthase